MSAITTLNGTPMSRLCFGAMQFGGTANAQESRAMYDACRASGINFFDTAHLYTGGASETLLGQFAKSARDDLIIATKVGYYGGSGRANILAGFDTSRARLGVDYIDILYLHRWDPDTALEETCETLAELQHNGMIRHIAVSNFAAWQVVKAQGVAAKCGIRIDMIQPMYSLVKRQAEVELFPMALSEDIAAVPYSPLAAGLLTGKYAGGGAGRLSEDARYAARYGQGWMHDAAVSLVSYAQERGLDPATVAVAWAAAHPAVTAPIISARNVGQLQVSLDAQGLQLAADDYAQIATFSPAPAPATDRSEETDQRVIP